METRRSILCTVAPHMLLWNIRRSPCKLSDNVVRI